MVKSKKMSKTSIAVIVLALLLVLSLCLGITGAWFTDRSGEKSANQTVKFGDVDIEMSVESAVKHANGTDEAQYVLINDSEDRAPGSQGYETTKEYHVVAGDKIITTFTFTNNSDVDIYYVIKHTNGATTEWLGLNNGVLAQITAAQDLNAGANINAGTTTYTFEIPTTVQYGGEFQVDGHTVQAVRGETIALLNGTYELRAVQKANVGDADDAFTLLTTAAEGTNWAANLYTAN